MEPGYGTKLMYPDDAKLAGAAQTRVTMNDLLANTIGDLTDIRRGLTLLEDRLFGESPVDKNDAPSPPMPDAMQWRVNSVAANTGELALRLKSILNRL